MRNMLCWLVLLDLILRVIALGCPPLQSQCMFDVGGANYFSGISASGSQAVVEGVFTLPGNHSSVMIIQMQDGTYDSNDSSFGAGGGPFTSGSNGYISLGRAGEYEFSFVSSASGNGMQTTLELALPLSRNFSSVGSARFQVIAFLMCDNMTVIGYPSIPWNGEVGGVLPIIGRDIHFNVDISMDGTGFRGGSANATEVTSDGDLSFATQYSPTDGHAFKGEGFLGSPQYPPQIGTYPNQKDCGRGAPGNAGGGGHSTIGGGGGGGNGGDGGEGGSGGYYSFEYYYEGAALIFGGYRMPSNRSDLLFLGALVP